MNLKARLVLVSELERKLRQLQRGVAFFMLYISLFSQRFAVLHSGMVTRVCLGRRAFLRRRHPQPNESLTLLQVPTLPTLLSGRPLPAHTVTKKLSLSVLTLLLSTCRDCRKAKAKAATLPQLKHQFQRARTIKRVSLEGQIRRFPPSTLRVTQCRE